MIGKYLAQGSFTRRILTRALVVGAAVYVGGLVMRSLPHEQTLLFPVGSFFPNATRFVASWKQPGDDEPRGGVSLSFSSAPPLQVRQHVQLPNGDYIVTIEIQTGPLAATPAVKSEVTPGARAGLQTNIERRVSLVGGETTIALAVPLRAEPSVSE